MRGLRLRGILRDLGRIFSERRHGNHTHHGRNPGTDARIFSSRETGQHRTVRRGLRRFFRF